MPDWDPDANELFLRALEITEPDDRERFLAEASAAQPDLRARVKALIRAHERAGEFLGRPLLELEGASTPRGDDNQTGPSAAGEIGLDFLAPTDKPGSRGRLGHYEVQAAIGRGGMGIVLKAFDENLHRVVAIKVMAPQLATTATARERFTREARAQAAVAHEHVVTIHAVEEANGLPYIVMEYVAGISLQDRLDRDGPFRLPEVLRIGAQAAAGLAAAHKQGLVHRDVTPANILLENGVERVKLTDFGLARAADDASLTASGQVAGTPMYMSPEQAEGKPVDTPSDLFSLGSVLYAMCAGRPPFRAASIMAVLKRVCEETPTPLREVNPEVPEWLADAIARLHAKDPAERFQSAADVADLLGQHLAHLQHPSVVSLPATAKPVAPSRPTPRRGRWAVAAAILGLLLVALGTTEATGVTHLRATVIRTFTPDGTLLVETDDPRVKVTVEGDGDLVITGAGPQEVRLRPGSYKVHAAKDGKPVQLDRDVVTITRGDKQVVRVRVEAGIAVAAPQPRPGDTPAAPFAVLTSGGQAERMFATLAEAVQAAGHGDTIEVRGDGPFVSAAIPPIHGRRLTLRAAAGTRPVLRWDGTSSPAFYKAQGNTKKIAFLHTDDALNIEGLELQLSSPLSVKQDQWTAYCLIAITDGATLWVANCRFRSTIPRQVRAIDAIHASNCVVQNTFLLWRPGRPFLTGPFILNNCVVATTRDLDVAWVANPAPWGGTVPNRLPTYPIRLNNNTLAGLTITGLGWPPTFLDPDKKPAGKLFDIEASGNVFDLRVVLYATPNGFRGDRAALFEGIENPADAERFFRTLITWRDRANLYSDAIQFFSTYGKVGVIAEMKLKEWASAVDSVQGRIRFRGGDLSARLAETDAPFTEEDFRLAVDSAGKGARKDGKDLGADIDLVGPGPAYETWKRMPEYRQWLKDTGQTK